MIEQAYQVTEVMGIPVWCQDEAVPFTTIPYEGESWQIEGEPQTYPHEYVKDGTAKLLTLFHPSDGAVRVKGVQSCTNQVLHPWLQQELAEILQALPTLDNVLSAEQTQQLWQRWRENLTIKFTLPPELPALRVLLVCDNLAGHKTPDLKLLTLLCGYALTVFYLCTPR